METKNNVYKTSFGMYVPFDYETYKKLKAIKAVANLSGLDAAKQNKVNRKRYQRVTKSNPTGDSPKDSEPLVPCRVLYVRKDYETSKYVPDPDSKYGYSSIEGVKWWRYERTVELMDFWDVWKVASKPCEKSEDVVVPKMRWFDLDHLYQECLKWREETVR